MTTTYMPVSMHVYSDGDDFDIVYSSSERQFTDRTEALTWGVEHYGSDDFRIATLTDGRLSAVGWGHDDFDPAGEDLPSAAANLGVEVAA